ncbi:DUF397 domain-containing protein [Streptomyces sp. NPDC016626]|uniref:DUF397 domain-containing protein n=1 Tax=Streptomyces sp. NPDC016626 TaxID=3364968 RepID=UPI0036F4F5AA
MESDAIPAGTQWRKSSYSSDQGGDCVEVAEIPFRIAVRDSKTPAEPVLALGSAAFAAFLTWTANATAERQ